MTGGGVCVACEAAATSVGMTLCPADVVAVVMTIAASAITVRLKADTTFRLKADTTLREQTTCTLPSDVDSMNHKGGDVAGPGDGF